MTQPELDRLVITVLTDNYYDALRPDTGPAKRFRARPGLSMHAEHGLSYFVETFSDGSSGRFVFDYGLDADGVGRNAALLGVDLATADGLGLSHGHFDHWSGLCGLLADQKGKIKDGTPLFVGPEAFAQRFALVPGTGERLDIGRLDQQAIETLGALRIVEVDRPTEVMAGGCFTGPIPRRTEYEGSNPALLVEREGRIEVDTFPGEQAMVFLVRGKGLVVLSSCAHSGIVNTVRHARQLTGVEKVHAIIGGFHLVNAVPEVVARTVADIKALEPDVVVPAHCTGFEATTLFAKEMPRQFILNTAGTRYTFSAS